MSPDAAPTILLVPQRLYMMSAAENSAVVVKACTTSRLMPTLSRAQTPDARQTMSQFVSTTVVRATTRFRSI